MAREITKHSTDKKKIEYFQNNLQILREQNPEKDVPVTRQSNYEKKF